MAVLVGDIKKKGRLLSMLFELTKPGTLENVIIKAQHNCVSERRNYSGRFIPIVHEYVLLIKKDTPLVYPLLMTRRLEGDIRDMPGGIFWLMPWSLFRGQLRCSRSMKRWEVISAPSISNTGKTRCVRPYSTTQTFFTALNGAFGG